MEKENITTTANKELLQAQSLMERLDRLDGKSVLTEERVGETATYQGHTIQIRTYFMDNQEDKKFIKANLDTIWEILQEGYSKLGGFKGIQYKSELMKKVSLVKLGFYDDEIVAVMVCNDYLGGHKAVGLTCTRNQNHEPGVLLVEMIIKENIEKWYDYIWAEISGRIEDIYQKEGGFNVKVKYANVYLGNIKIQPQDDYHYTRLIQGVPETKTIYGIKDINKIVDAMKDDLDTLKNFLKDKENQFLLEDTIPNNYYRKQTPLEIAKIVVDSFADYKYNYFYNEFPSDLFDELKKNVAFIEGEINAGHCPQKLLKNMKECVRIGKDIIKTSSEFKPFKLS